MRVLSLLCVVAVCVVGVVQGREVNGSGLVVTPFGRHYAECVHGVPDGAVVVNEDTHLVVHHESFAEPRRIRRCNLAFPSRPPSMRDSFDDDDSGVHGNGWQAYVEQKVSGRVTKMLGRWTTPELPSEDAQTLFTFPGLQNINWVPPNPEPGTPFDIIQPVLQYGSSSAGAFDAWSIASWYVTLGTDVVYSTLKKINPGDKLFGNMTRTGDDSWFINTVDETSGTTSGFTVTRSILKSQPWAYVALEVYDVDTCAQFPGQPGQLAMPYTDLVLEVDGKEQAFEWVVGTAGQKPPTCDASINVESPSQVTITW